MAIAFVAVGVHAWGATSAAPAYPAVTAGNQLLLFATCKPDTSTFPTISGWTKQVDVSVGSGDGGAGNGPQRLALYTRIADGGESGTVTVTPSGTPNVVGAIITEYSVAGGQAFQLVIETGSDTAAAANLSCTAGSIIGETAADVMVWGAAASADSNMGSATVTATDATYGTATERADDGIATGSAARLNTGDRPVSSGTASAATVFTANITATVTGGTVFVRLREVAGGAPPDLTFLRPVTNPVPLLR